MKSRFLKSQWLISLLVIIITAIAAYFLAKSRPPVEVKAKAETIPEIKVVELTSQSINIPVYTQGLLEPRTKVRLVAEVNGRILTASQKWMNGGFVRKGEELLGVEDFYYQNQLARAKANLAQAESALKQEQGVAYVVKQDWEKRNTGANSDLAKELGLREPQMRAIEASLEAAKADEISAAELLRKTKVIAPFDGVIANKVVDAGQSLSAGTVLADLLAIDVAEIKVPLTEVQQSYLNLPALSNNSNIRAEINYRSEDKSNRWQGKLVRTEGVLDPVTKVLNAVVQIQDPYGLKKSTKTPLRLGSFVEVKLEGKKIDNIFILPRRLLYTGNVVWLINAENKMESRQVKILPIRDANVYIYEGLKVGEKLIASGTFGLLDGKLVKPVAVATLDEAGSNE